MNLISSELQRWTLLWKAFLDAVLGRCSDPSITGHCEPPSQACGVARNPHPSFGNGGVALPHPLAEESPSRVEDDS